MRSPRFRLIALLALCVVACPSLALPARTETAPLEFHLTFDPAVSEAPFTGRVYVLLSRRRVEGLSSGMNWFRPEPTFARDVKDWKPGETLVVGAEALGHPVKLADLEKGAYFVQAVMDLDRGSRPFTRCDGNGYSLAGRHELDPKASGPISLKIDQVYREPAFRETDRVKLVDVPSKLLTAFHGRPTRLRAGVVLPESWAEGKGRRYPVVYEVPGFGGRHTGAHGRLNRTNVAGEEMIWVVLDPDCRLGHHVFADSANNGPCGRALVEELIPAIEQRFRGVGKPWARFVTGHSSGGWSSLWLQVTYPDFFGGVWSTAPDPVDFRDFQRIDLYRAGVNFFKDDERKPRPLARRGGEPILYFQGFSDMEVVMGRGGQLASFEAVFSPRGEGGKPCELWDRKTGAVDAEVARAWQRYDIRLVLERDWETLGPKLAGKLHVYTGGEDTFYLEGAVKLLKESLEKLGSDAVVEIVPGKNHGSLLDPRLRQRIAREMAEQYRRHAPAGGG